jgi:hypothetical protein
MEAKRFLLWFPQKWMLLRPFASLVAVVAERMLISMVSTGFVGRVKADQPIASQEQLLSSGIGHPRTGG